MKNFALAAGTNVKVLGVNVRSERHGKSHVPAVDLKLQLTAANTVLDELKGPDLRLALYMRAEEGGEPPQGELDGIEPITDTPLLRLNGIEPIRLQDELTGYTATLDIGIGRKESLVELVGCKVNKFEVDALQGGSVRIVFRIQAAGLKEREIGKLGVLIDCDVPLLLEPPAEQEALPVGAAAAAISADEAAETAISAAMKKAKGSTKLKDDMRRSAAKTARAAKKKSPPAASGNSAEAPAK